MIFMRVSFRWRGRHRGAPKRSDGPLVADDHESDERVLGRVDGDALICDLAVIGEYAHVGGSTIVCGDDIVTGETPQPVESSPRNGFGNSGEQACTTDALESSAGKTIPKRGLDF